MSIFQPGTVYHHLRIDRFLAAGAHGEVYACHHLTTDEPLAVKVTRLARPEEDAPEVQRAIVTAQGAASLAHPNVVRVRDLGCDPEGIVYVVMELLRGCSIDALIRWGRVSTVFALSVAIEAAQGFVAAHAAGIVHRDVKPANLFLVNAGPHTTIVKVLDFSTAKVFSAGVETSSGTRPGLGTVAYAAPEQLYGATPHPGMDVYGLGMTLWELLAGWHPYYADLGDPMELRRKQREEMPPLLSEVSGLPPRIDDVLRRAIAKRPAARYASIDDFAATLSDLRTWLVDEERSGHLLHYVPAGQPPIPGDVNPYDLASMAKDPHR
jgi:serine/threonine-protein kinase